MSENIERYDRVRANLAKITTSINKVMLGKDVWLFRIPRKGHHIVHSMTPNIENAVEMNAMINVARIVGRYDLSYVSRMSDRQARIVMTAMMLEDCKEDGIEVEHEREDVDA